MIAASVEVYSALEHTYPPFGARAERLRSPEPPLLLVGIAVPGFLAGKLGKHGENVVVIVPVDDRVVERVAVVAAPSTFAFWRIGIKGHRPGLAVELNLLAVRDPLGRILDANDARLAVLPGDESAVLETPAGFEDNPRATPGETPSPESTPGPTVLVAGRGMLPRESTTTGKLAPGVFPTFLR